MCFQPQLWDLPTQLNVSLPTANEPVDFRLAWSPLSEDFSILKIKDLCLLQLNVVMNDLLLF